MSDTGGKGGAAVGVEACWRVSGPFFHGTRALLHDGDELVAGRASNVRPGRLTNNASFTALLDTAVWGAELAAALAGQDQRGHVHGVEPTGPFEAPDRPRPCPAVSCCA